MENNVQQIKKNQKTPYVRYAGDERIKALTRTAKVCNKCGILKSLNEYSKQKECIDGHVGMCKVCRLEKSRQWVRENRDKYRASCVRFRIKHPIRWWAGHALRSHKYKGDVVNITTDELEKLATRTTHCPFCGRFLDYTPLKGKIYDNSPSLDRVDNGHILDKTNVMILCQMCNRTKGSRSFSEFMEYCKQVLRRVKL